MFPLDGASRGLTLVGDVHATYEELYRTQPWVQVVVNRLARSISRLPLKVFVNPDEPSERERVRDGELFDLLRRPEPRRGQNRLKLDIVSNVAIHGNHVLVKDRARTGLPPTALLSTSAKYWRARRDSSNQVWYVFSPGNGGPFHFRAEDVIHFRWWEGGNGLWANSPLDSLRTTLMNEDATQRHTIATFENGARPSGIYTTTVEDDDLVKRQAENLKRIFGGPDNAAKLALIRGDVKWNPMSHTIVDSDLINLRKLDREEVAAVYNMPPPVIGILDRATYSNITEQHLMEAVDTIQPWTSMIQEEFSVQLIDGEPRMAGQYVEFEFGVLLQGDPMKQFDLLTKAVGGPILTADEARARLNMPPLNTPQSSTLAPPANASVKGDAGDDGRS